jgi:hypothetical protein
LKEAIVLGKIAERKRKRRIVAVSMSEVWNKIYKSDSTFFGEEPSNLPVSIPLVYSDQSTTR